MIEINLESVYLKDFKALSEYTLISRWDSEIKLATIEAELSPDDLGKNTITLPPANSKPLKVCILLLHTFFLTSI